MKNVLKDAAILFAITLIAGFLLGAVYEVTKGPIAETEANKKKEACQEVFASAADFAVEELTGDTQAADSVDIDGLYQALDESGSILGYVLEITSHEGYNGDIQFAMGIANDGTVNGISLLSISETPGLGMRAEEVLKPQFSDKKVTHFEYTKVGAVTDDQIDAISGATITTNAVTNAVNAGLDYFYTNLAEGRDGQ